MFGRGSMSSGGGPSVGSSAASSGGGRANLNSGSSNTRIAALCGRLERFHKMGLFVEYKVAGATLAVLVLILVSCIY